MTRPFALTVVLAALLCAPGAAAAAAPPLSGSVSKPGFSVIALALNGRARSAEANRKFRIAPPAKVVTLHLRDKRGRYAGPVVVGRKGKRLVLGVKAGAKLGRISVRKGFGVARVKPAKRVAARWARARKGRPIGARVLGRIRSKASGRAGAGRDPDRDGIPGAFDVDDDGDLVFDSVDRKPAGAGAAQAGQTPDQTPDPGGGDGGGGSSNPALGPLPGGELNARWVMNGGLQVASIADQRGITKGAAGYALNQNAAGPFAKDGDFEKLRDLMMKERGGLFFALPGQPTELDCGGLSYCSAGGTGFFFTRSQPFPSQFDDDADGFGSMEPVPGFREGQDGLGLIRTVDPSTVFGLAPLAGDSEIKAGDVYIERIGGGAQTERPITLGSIFGTLPALAAWTDGGPETSDVTIDYPVPEGGKGTESNGYVVSPDEDGNRVLTLSIWRPQRPAIPNSGEGSGWIDIGGLTYTVVGKTAEQNRRLFGCNTSSYSTEDDNVSVTPDGLLDSAADEPVNVDNTLTFTVNLTECLADSGITEARPPTITVFVAASSAFGDVAEGVGFSFKW